MNSREKGKRGERQWRDELRANGYTARRGQQFSGSPDSPDVVCDELGWIHFEVKAVERLNIEDAMEQARRDGGASRTGHQKTPVVAHRRSHRRWLVTMEADAFFRLLRGELPPADRTDGTDRTDAGARIIQGALKCVPAEARPVRQVRPVPNDFGKVSGASPGTAREPVAAPLANALPENKPTEQTKQTEQ